MTGFFDWLALAGVLFIALLLFLWRPVRPGTLLKGQVAKVCDGDTVWIRLWYGRRLKLRLAGIDAPESEQRFGIESQRILERFVGQRRVSACVIDRDRYGRLVSEIECRGIDVCEAMIREGAAWPYFAYLRNLPPEKAERYRQAGRDARIERRGLWYDANPETPWDWRTRHRSLWARFLLWLKRLFFGRK